MTNKKEKSLEKCNAKRQGLLKRSLRSYLLVAFMGLPIYGFFILGFELDKVIHSQVYAFALAFIILFLFIMFFVLNTTKKWIDF